MPEWKSHSFVSAAGLLFLSSANKTDATKSVTGQTKESKALEQQVRVSHSQKLSMPSVGAAPCPPVSHGAGSPLYAFCKHLLTALRLTVSKL